MTLTREKLHTLTFNAQTHAGGVRRVIQVLGCYCRRRAGGSHHHNGQLGNDKDKTSAVLFVKKPYGKELPEEPRRQRLKGGTAVNVMYPRNRHGLLGAS